MFTNGSIVVKLMARDSVSLRRREHTPTSMTVLLLPEFSHLARYRFHQKNLRCYSKPLVLYHKTLTNFIALSTSRRLTKTMTPFHVIIPK